MTLDEDMLDLGNVDGELIVKEHELRMLTPKEFLEGS